VATLGVKNLLSILPTLFSVACFSPQTNRSILRPYPRTHKYGTSRAHRKAFCYVKAYRYSQAIPLPNAGPPVLCMLSLVEGGLSNAAPFLLRTLNRAAPTMASSTNSIIAISVACLFFFSDAASQQQQWLFYSPAVSRLQGKLVKVTKYGKPTYGANAAEDEKIEVPIVVLQTPVRVKSPTPNSVNIEMTNVSFVQLIFPAEAGSYSKHLDTNIVVEGTLERGRKGEHFTDLVMIVKAVNPTQPPTY